jgi:hypothetical protein
MTESIFSDSATSIVVAGKGGGKTGLLASEANKMKKFVFVDTIGVLNPKNENRSAVIPNSNYFLHSEKGSAVDSFKSWHGNPAAQKFDRHVLDISEAGDKKEEIEKLSEFLLQLGKKGRGYPLILDEMSLIAPQGKGAGTVFKNLVIIGRNFQIKPLVMATQRPQNTDKEVLELADESYLGYNKGVNTTEMLGKIADIDPSIFKKLKPRQFYIVGKETVYSVPFYRYAHQQK